MFMQERMEASSEASDSTFSDNSFLWADTASDSTNDSLVDKEQAFFNVNEINVKMSPKKKVKHIHNESIVLDNDSFLDEKVKLEQINQTEDNSRNLKKKKRKVKSVRQNSDDEIDDSLMEMPLLQRSLKYEGKEDIKPGKIKKKCIDYNSQSTSSGDDTYLDMRVKMETKSSGEPEQKSKKRKRPKSSESSQSEGDHCSQSNKRKKFKSVDETNVSSNVVDDKFTAEETVVQQRQLEIPYQPKSKQNDTLLGQSDEDSSDEISAINGYDDHNLHTTLFSNKSIERDISKNSNASSDCDTSPTKRQKISDRILFEDDDDNYNSQPSKLNHYLRKNPFLKNVTNSLNSSAIITSDDRLWVLKCPKNVDISDFQDIHFKMDGSSKIKLDGQSYESSVVEEKYGSITVLSMNHTKYDLKHLPLHGVITLRKRLPKLQLNEDNIMANNQMNFIPLPETKCRHPLLGVHYKKALKSAERVIAKEIKELTSDIITKKKKRNKNPITTDMEDERIDELVLKRECDPSSDRDSKKKKKRKHVGEAAPAPCKRRERDLEAAEAWESEKAIEENLFTI